MKRLTLIIAACAVLAVPAVVTAQAPTTLELVQLEREVRGGFVDNPPKRRESAGDVFTIRGPVRDAAGRAVGTSQAVFTQTARRSAHGGATFTLADGSIEVSGRLSGDTNTLAIVGGTGAYAGATGSVVITEPRGRTAFRFTFGS